VVSLSPQFSRRLHDVIRLQAARPFNQATYDQARKGLQRCYPTREARLVTAIARTHSGA
jgi:hypothetical protein